MKQVLPVLPRLVRVGRITKEEAVADFDIRQETKAVCRYRHSRYISLLAEFDPLTSRIRTASYYNVMFITAGHSFSGRCYKCLITSARRMALRRDCLFLFVLTLNLLAPTAVGARINP